MKITIRIIALYITTATIALAACPPHAPYGCTQMPNGKMLCGCGVR
jgi:hypothetical protein